MIQDVTHGGDYVIQGVTHGGLSDPGVTQGWLCDSSCDTWRAM